MRVASCLAAGWLLAATAQPQGSLGVRPEQSVELSGVAGRLAETVRGEVRLSNGEGTKIDWRASADRDWLEIPETRGSLRIGEEHPLRLRVHPERGQALGAGLHEARLRIVNLTSNRGSTTLRVRLQVRDSLGLAVEQEAIADEPGGADRVRFTVRNEGGSEWTWRVRPSELWLQVTPAQGQLAPGRSTAVTVSLGERARERLGQQRRRVGLAFVNEDTGSGTTQRTLEIVEGRFHSVVQADSVQVERRSSLEQFGITWTFDRPYPVGRFANGDHWVQGPCLVVGIDPVAQVEAGRTANGSMVNPSPRAGMTQAYDSAMYGKYADETAFNPRQNVARGVGWKNPLVLGVGRSLVSTLSHPNPGERPQLETAAILTVLSAPVPEGTFRPPYSGVDKRPRHHVDQLDLSLLKSLEPVASTPPLAEVERMFERPWIDHVVGWFGRYIHPRENMPDYGREITDQVSVAALMLHLDFPEEQKRTLLIRFVQLGIDFFGILEAGGSWPPSAGHLNGRKWPILFAGLMLGDQRMANIGSEHGPEIFSEDGQTFYVGEGHRRLGYRADQVGLAEWGTSHATRAELDDPRWFHTEEPVPGPRVRPELVELRTQSIKYRLCCTANTWWGQLLAARLMDAVPLWGHDAVFDYQDRFLEVNQAAGVTDYRLAWQPFYLDMWLRYRADT